MTKQELTETYTAEQLAEMVVNLQNDIKLKVGELGLPMDCDILKCKCDKCGNEFIAVLDSDYQLVKRNCKKRKGKNMNISDIQKCQDEYEKLLKESPLHGTIDKICEDIIEQKNNAMAMEFTRIICDLLKRYGVYVHCTETKFGEKTTTNSIEEHYGIIFDSMDFSQHDKEFTDKIKELEKQLDRSKTTINQIDEILEELFGVTHDVENPGAFKGILREKVNEKISDFLPTEPIKVAEMLINAEEEYEHNPLVKKICGNDKGAYQIFDISELRQIAEHLLIYCNHNKEEEE